MWTHWRGCGPADDFVDCCFGFGKVGAAQFLLEAEDIAAAAAGAVAIPSASGKIDGKAGVAFAVVDRASGSELVAGGISAGDAGSIVVLDLTACEAWIASHGRPGKEEYGGNVSDGLHKKGSK